MCIYIYIYIYIHTHIYIYRRAFICMFMKKSLAYTFKMCLSFSLCREHLHTHVYTCTQMHMLLRIPTLNVCPFISLALALSCFLSHRKCLCVLGNDDQIFRIDSFFCTCLSTNKIHEWFFQSRSETKINTSVNSGNLQKRRLNFKIRIFCTIALRTPEERLPSGTMKKKFGRMILGKKSSVGDRTNVQSPPSATAHGGEAWRQNVWRSVYIRLSLQLSLTLACIKTLPNTLPNIHRASHVPAPRLTSTSTCRRRWLNFGTVPQGRFLSKIVRPNFSFGGPWGKPLLRGAQRAYWEGQLADGMSNTIGYFDTVGYQSHSVTLAYVNCDSLQSHLGLTIL